MLVQMAYVRLVRGEWIKASQLIDEMRRRGLKPDRYSYTSAIHACGKARSPLEALRLLRAMDTNNVGTFTFTVVYPNFIVLGTNRSRPGLGVPMCGVWLLVTTCFLGDGLIAPLSDEIHRKFAALFIYIYIYAGGSGRYRDDGLHGRPGRGREVVGGDQDIGRDAIQGDYSQREDLQGSGFGVIVYEV